MKIYEETAAALRKKLHKIPETSMREVKTKATLMDFLKDETKLEIVDKGCWFYAVLRSSSASGYCKKGNLAFKTCSDQKHIDEKALAFRADFDSVTGEDGVCRHICGHDGHSAALAAFGKWLSDNVSDNKTDIILLFQPGEESGEGAAVCEKIFEEENIGEIYGFHNIPGYDEGTILIKRGTFACASTGLEIRFTGAPAHAAYPEAGANPAEAFAELILSINKKLAEKARGIVLATVIGLELGSDKYGVSASEGILRLTVRAEFADEFAQILDFIKNEAINLAKKHHLKYSSEEHERFPSTENEENALKKVSEAARKAGLNTAELTVPFRWSEDFGRYLNHVPGAFFGVGDGVGYPELHTADFEFNDKILPNVLKLYAEIVRETIRKD